MGKLKLEAKERMKNDPELMQCGGRRLEDIQKQEHPRWEDEIACLAALEAIDDDDWDAIEAARSQAEDVAGMSKHSMPSRLPLEIIEPPQDFTAENLSSSSNLVFQEFDEIEDEPQQEDSELQLEFELLAKALEDFF